MGSMELSDLGLDSASVSGSGSTTQIKDAIASAAGNLVKNLVKSLLGQTGS